MIRVRQREEENEENRLSEEAERTFDRSRGDDGGDDDEDEAIAAAEQPDAAGPPADAAFQVENESPAPRSTFTVPAIVTAT